MGTSPILGLPTLEAAMNQKYLTVNQALLYLDVLTNLNVFNRTTTTPPATPAQGDRYIVPATGATGVWTGQANKIALYMGTTWVFFTPAKGWRAYDQTADVRLVYSGTAWVGTPATSILTESPNGARMTFNILEELRTVTGAFIDTVIAIPNGAIVFNVSVRVVTTITGATSFSVGTAASASQFGSAIPVTTGSTNFGTIGPSGFYANTPIRLTAAGANFTAGSVRVAIHYYLPRVPQT